METNLTQFFDQVKAAAAAVIAAWGAIQIVLISVKGWLQRWTKILAPLIQEAEKRALDGSWDPADRKALVLTGLKILEQEGKIKLNTFSRFVAGKLADKIANGLPNFTISKEAIEVMERARAALMKP